MNAGKSRKKPESVNSGVDIYLKLQVFSGLPDRSRHLHRICLLQIGERCDVLKTLNDWAQSSHQEYIRIVDKLKQIAENEDLPCLKTIKRVGEGKRIVQVTADNARLYGFPDSDTNSYTFVCVNTFWVGSGNKKKSQNKEIREAGELMDRWQNAQPVVGYPDVRIEKRGH
jgi:hypothetical protein